MSPPRKGFGGMRIAILLFALGLGSLARTAMAEPRVALVIGNSSYGGDLGELPNPANDARLMAKTLKRIGFEVIEAENADQARMKRAIQEFGDKLSKAGGGSTGLFFYAGHGLQVAGTNYLIPIHAKIQREPDVDMEAIPVDLVMKQMAFAESAVNIVILDACRNNPLSRGFRGITRGLADPAVRPMGSFIAYSTAPGDVAEDGRGANSPYTTALAETITKPGVSINDVFQEVRGKVLAATGQKQVPWDSSSLTAAFYFVAPAVAAPAPAGNAVDPKAVELAFWDAIKDSKSAEDYQAYLSKFPDGDFAPLAQIRLKQADQTAVRVVPASPAVAPSADSSEPDASAFERAFWNSVTDDDAVDGYRAYLGKYPSGRFADPARKRIAALDGSASPQQAAVTPPPEVPLPEMVEGHGKLYARDKARLRSAPSGDAAVVARLSAGTPLEATGHSIDSTWWRVSLPDGRTGFVAASAATDQPPPVVAPPAVAPSAVAPAIVTPAPAVAAKPAGTDSELCYATTDVPAEPRADACRRLLAAGIADETDHYNALMDLGQALFDQGKNDEAMRNYRAAAELDPKFYGAFYMIGRVHLDQSRYTEARAAFDKAAALDPAQPDPILYRGATARRLGDVDGAMADVQRAIAMKSDDASYYDELGYLHLFKGDLAAAAADTDRAMALDPQYATASGVFSYYLSRRYDDALAMADRTVKNDPGFLYWWIWKALIERAKGDGPGAAATLAEARKVFGKAEWPAPLLDYIAGKIPESALRELGRVDDPRTQAERLCEIEFYVAEQAVFAGDTERAKAAIRRSLDSRIYYYIEYMVAPARLALLNQP